MKSIYAIRIRERAPGMNQRTETFTAPSYADAVAYAQNRWRETRTSVTLHSGPHDTYYWHYVNGNGEAVDRNHGSGVPELTVIS